MHEDPAALLRSPGYLRLLVLATALGPPISAAAYGFLSLVHLLQEWVYESLPHGLGFAGTPNWWPVPVLALAGMVVGLVVRYLPGGGGHQPVDGFSMGLATGRELPGICVAALVGLGLGAVLGPEAPLIALGGGLAALALGPSARNRPERAVALVASVGSFAAVATLLGSPIVGAFLLMEAIGIGGPMLSLVLLPGLLAAGVGSLIFIGLGRWTGLGPLSLTIPNLPVIAAPDVPQFVWAVAIGLAGAVVGLGIHRLGRVVQAVVRRNILLLTPVLGTVTGLLAYAFAETTNGTVQQVLFSGQEALDPLLTRAETYPVGLLVGLVVYKGLAYAVALGSFRGGPVFPAMLIGAAGGLALSHLPGLPPIAGAAMGIGAVSVTMLRLPLSSVLLTSLFLGTNGLKLMPLVIVSVVVAFVASARLAPAPVPASKSPATQAGRDPTWR